MGDTQFHFRIRQCPGRKPHNQCLVDYNKDCPAALQVTLLKRFARLLLQIKSDMKLMLYCRVGNSVTLFYQ